MKLKQRIYCIEGVWDYGKREVEPSNEPLLEMLRRQGQWEYARRDCATVDEMKYYLEHEWVRCQPGSVLYFATHGSRGNVCLSSDDESLGMDELGEFLAGRCTDRLVHFGGCNVLGGRAPAVRQRVKAFLDVTQAMGVSGYGAAVGWTNVLRAPAAALELMLFSSIREEKISLANGRQFKSLSRIVTELQEKFTRCKFDLYTRLDDRLYA